MSLSFEDKGTRIYTTLEFPKHQVMDHLYTQKNGSILQSKYQDQMKETPPTPHTVSPTIFGTFRKLCTRCMWDTKNSRVQADDSNRIHCNDKIQAWGKGKYKNIWVLNLDIASVQAKNRLGRKYSRLGISPSI